jgi:putative ABC transport system permease protein
VVAQISLALVLLVGSGLLIRSFVRLVSVDPGFEARNLLTFSVTLPNARYGTNAARIAFFRQFLERARNLPGVRSVSMDSFPPLSGLGAATSVRLTAQPNRAAADLPVAAVRIVGPDYFPTMGIPLRAGRTFNARELAEMRHVAVVNQAFADQYLAGINPLGQQMIVDMKSQEENENSPSEIVGVVGDVHLMGLDTPAQPTVYWPHPELVMSRMTILVRAFNDPDGLVSALRGELRQMDRDQPMASVDHGATCFGFLFALAFHHDCARGLCRRRFVARRRRHLRRHRIHRRAAHQ